MPDLRFMPAVMAKVGALLQAADGLPPLSEAVIDVDTESGRPLVVFETDPVAAYGYALHFGARPTRGRLDTDTGVVEFNVEIGGVDLRWIVDPDARIRLVPTDRVEATQVIDPVAPIDATQVIGVTR